MILLRNKAQLVGEVEASDEKAAEAVAAAQFGLDAELRKRIAVQPTLRVVTPSMPRRSDAWWTPDARA